MQDARRCARAADAETPAPSDEARAADGDPRPAGGGSERQLSGARRLALRQQAVAADVAAGAADAHVDRVLRAPTGCGTSARSQRRRARSRPARATGLSPSPKRNSIVARWTKYSSSWRSCRWRPRRVAGREDDRVDAEGGHAELLADLAEARPLAHLVEVADGPAVARRCLRHGRHTRCDAADRRHAGASCSSRSGAIPSGRRCCSTSTACSRRSSPSPTTRTCPRRRGGR